VSYGRESAQNYAKKLKFRTWAHPKKYGWGRTRRATEAKTLGRPQVIVDREKVRQLHGQGDSVRIIAAQLGLTKSTVHSIVAG
jgi:transposase